MKVTDPQLLEVLDRSWESDSGVLGKLRDGIFDPDLAHSYLTLLQGIEITEGEKLPRDFVRLLWFAPLFSEWQIERAKERGADGRAVSDFCDHVRERVMQILGTP